MVVPAAGGDLFARPRVVDGPPFSHNMEIRPNLEEFLQKERPSFTGQFFEGQYLYPIVIELQMAAVRLDFRIAKLEVEISAAMQDRNSES